MQYALAQDEGMYAFASGVSTAMLSGIGIAVGIMFFMTIMALFYRSAMGGRKDWNIGKLPGWFLGRDCVGMG